MEIGLWNSQGGGKDKHPFFLSTFLSLNHIKKNFFFFKLMIKGTDDYTTMTEFKLCTKDYKTTIYTA